MQLGLSCIFDRICVSQLKFCINYNCKSKSENACTFCAVLHRYFDRSPFSLFKNRFSSSILSPRSVLSFLKISLPLNLFDFLFSSTLPIQSINLAKKPCKLTSYDTVLCENFLCYYVHCKRGPPTSPKWRHIAQIRQTKCNNDDVYNNRPKYFFFRRNVRSSFIIGVHLPLSAAAERVGTEL